MPKDAKGKSRAAEGHWHFPSPEAALAAKNRYLKCIAGRRNPLGHSPHDDDLKAKHWKKCPSLLEQKQKCTCDYWENSRGEQIKMCSCQTHV